MTGARRYLIMVFPDPYEEGYVVHVPDFPGVCAGGDTPGDALDCAYEGIASILGVLIEDGRPIPGPSATPSLAA